MRYLPQALLLVSAYLLTFLLHSCQPGEEADPIYLSAVKCYAETMIDAGRDVYGPEYSPLFASSLNRATMKPDTAIANVKIPGVRKTDRSLAGANMIHDIDLYQILYELTTINGDHKYAEEADKALAYFFDHCQSPVTGLMCWGEHLYWNFDTEDCGYAPNFDMHETAVWPFWERSYQLAPAACWKFAIGEWDHQINDQLTGDFSRHARYTRHETYSGFDFPRYAGQMIERWAYAYQRPENANKARREELQTAIKVLFHRMVENAKLSKSGYLIAGRSPKGDHINVVWLTSNLELARCLEEAAPSMPPDIADHMRVFAAKQDDDFLNAPHRLDSAGGGFAVTLHAETGLPRVRSMNRPYTSTWSSGYGYSTHAGVANTCFNRHKKLAKSQPGKAAKYKELILMTAEKYLISTPDTTQLLKPREYADVIELMLNSYELTGQQKYLTRAGLFAQQGMDLFMDDGNCLPKATNQHAHYESITGGPGFMYQLLQIHLATKK